MRGLEFRFHLERAAVAAEMEKVDRLIEWWSGEPSKMKTKEWRPHFYNLSYGDLRWLKTGMLLKIKDLKNQRDVQFSKYPFLPVSVVETVNSKIASYENLSESGVFNSMEPIPLAIESTTAAPVKIEVADAMAQDPKGPAIVMRVELLDAELRRRCGDLYVQFAADPTHQDRFDTVLRDASVVLEERIRRVSGFPDTLIGEELLARALAVESGELILSTEKNEQKAVHLLFLGFFGFVRNSVNHRLVPNYTRERAAQVLGLADYLLFLLSQAKRRNPPVAAPAQI
jgi:hypothetical protein